MHGSLRGWLLLIPDILAVAFMVWLLWRLWKDEHH